MTSTFLLLLAASGASAIKSLPHHPSPFGLLLQPKFLADLDQEARREFFSITANQSSSRRETKNYLIDWAERNNVTDEFREFDEHSKSAAEKRKVSIVAAIQKLPAAFAELSSIYEDENLSSAEAQKKIQTSFKSQDDDVKRFLIAISLPYAMNVFSGIKTGMEPLRIRRSLPSSEGQQEAFQAPNQRNNLPVFGAALGRPSGIPGNTGLGLPQGFVLPQPLGNNGFSSNGNIFPGAIDGFNGNNGNFFPGTYNGFGGSPFAVNLYGLNGLCQFGQSPYGPQVSPYGNPYGFGYGYGGFPFGNQGGMNNGFLSGIFGPPRPFADEKNTKTTTPEPAVVVAEEGTSQSEGEIGEEQNDNESSLLASSPSTAPIPQEASDNDAVQSTTLED